MSDDTDITEQLAAYLAGELDDDASTAVANRIDSEPWVARMADDMADLLMELGQVDDVEPPDGFVGRLAEGVGAQVGRPAAVVMPDARSLSAASAAATGWPDAARGSRREVRGPRISPRFLAVAAGFAVLAIGTIGLLRNADFGSSEDSAATADSGQQFQELGRDDEVAADDEATDAAAVEEEAMSDADADAMSEEDVLAQAEETAGAVTAPTPAEGDAGAGEQLSMPAPSATTTAEAEEDSAADAATEMSAEEGATTSAGPTVLTLGTIDDDADTLRTLVGQDPAAQNLLGLERGAIAEVAATFRDEILRSAPYADGLPAATCLQEVLVEAGPDLVPAVAARVDLAGTPAVAFALVRSAEGDVLDAVDVWVVDSADCQVVQFVSGG